MRKLANPVTLDKIYAERLCVKSHDSGIFCPAHPGCVGTPVKFPGIPFFLAIGVCNEMGNRFFGHLPCSDPVLPYVVFYIQ